MIRARGRKFSLATLIPATLVFASAITQAVAAGAPSLSMPLSCTIGTDCWIQNLVDFDSGPKWKDPFCGPASFNKHKGTDFRIRYLPDLQRNVAVLNMAPGTVLAMRNDMKDHLVTGLADVKKIQGKECGNGALIDHGDGWTTQICHMAKGSLTIKKGDRLKRGQPVGKIGLSGHTTFPHVHVTVRKGQTVIDPLTGLAQTDPCSPQTGLSKNTLWDAKAKAQITGASTALLSGGFSSAPVKSAQLLQGKSLKPAADGPLILYAHFINLRVGDRVDLTITGPDGPYAASKGKPLKAAKANWTIYAGKRGKLPKGTSYRGSIILYRDNKPIIIKDDVMVKF